MYQRGRRAWIVGLAVAIAAAVVMLGLILGTRGSSKDPVISSTVAAPTASCVEGGAKVSVENAHFAAFQGALRPHAGGKLLLVDVKLDDGGSIGDVPGAAEFKVVDPQDVAYSATAVPDSPSVGGVVSTLHLLFDVPKSLGTARLVRSTGCPGDTWDVP